jgi:uncharacterized protein (TIGR02301 family)
MGRSFILVLAIAASLASAAAPALAVEAPYESRLMRLAEILGSLHYLRNLCGDKGSQWRDEMGALIASENPTAERRARLVASFNRGYRSYSDIYKTCTASAAEAIARYMKEGEDLSRDTANRFGN